MKYVNKKPRRTSLNVKVVVPFFYFLKFLTFFSSVPSIEFE